MEIESPLCAGTSVRVALSRMFSMPKGMEIILHHRLQYSALKIPVHFASSCRMSVKIDWPYSKDRAGSARTSSVSSQNLSVPFTDMTLRPLVRPASSDKWKAYVRLRAYILRRVRNACKMSIACELSTNSNVLEVCKRLYRTLVKSEKTFPITSCSHKDSRDM